METTDKPIKMAMSDGIKDLITAVGILLFALAGFFFINPEGNPVWPGPGGMSWRTLPFFYAGLLTLLSLAYIGQSILKIRKERRSTSAAATQDPSPEAQVVLFRRITTVVLLLGYVSLIKLFGFALMTPVFLFCLFRLYERGPWRGDLLISLLGSILLWTLFVRILHLNLKGNLFDPVTPFLLNALKTVGL